MKHIVKGKIIAISEAQTFDSGAKKRNFQIDTGEDYNNIYSFDLFKTGDYVKIVDEFEKYNKVGDSIEVEFYVNCREWEGKYYTNLSAWRIEPVGGGSLADANTTETFVNEGDDDLPF